MKIASCPRTRRRRSRAQIRVGVQLSLRLSNSAAVGSSLLIVLIRGVPDAPRRPVDPAPRICFLRCPRNKVRVCAKVDRVLFILVQHG